MWLTNEYEFGHLVNADSVQSEYPHSELWEVERNALDWESRYLSPQYREVLEGGLGNVFLAGGDAAPTRTFAVQIVRI